MMTLSQAQAIAIAIMDSLIEQDKAAHKHGSLWANELKQAQDILRTNRQSSLEWRKIKARKMVLETSLSFREIARQTNLSHETVRQIWQNSVK